MEEGWTCLEWIVQVKETRVQGQGGQNKFGGDGDRTGESWYGILTHNQLDCVDCDDMACGLYFD